MEKNVEQKPAQVSSQRSEYETLLLYDRAVYALNTVVPATIRPQKQPQLHQNQPGHSIRDCGKNPACWWVRTVGCVLVAAAAVAISLKWEKLFNSLLNNTLVLSNNSRTYNQWVAPDQPIYFEVFLFNWTNPEGFPKQKPKLEQIGPYRYREIRTHVNVTIFEHNSTVAYMTKRSWIFEAATSNGSLTDTITTINMPAASAAYMNRYAGVSTKLVLGMVFESAKYNLHVTTTVGKILFEGYEDPLVLMSKYFPSPPGTPHFDRFGWFYKRNNSIHTDGYMEVTSGAGGTLVGQILKWNHRDSLPFFNGSCSQLYGTAGEFVRRDLEVNSTLTMFVPDLCRTVHMDYVASGSIKGVSYHKFEMLDRVFDKSSVSENNSCFCNGLCKWSGVMNISACSYGSPSFLTLPHFLHGDPALRANVEGLDPDPEKHSFFFSVEPKLGVPVDVAGRFQFNVYLEKVSLLRLFHNVPNMLFPVFWVQQHVTVADDIFMQLRIVLWLQQWGGTVIAVLALTLGAFVLVTCTRHPKYITWRPFRAK